MASMHLTVGQPILAAAGFQPAGGLQAGVAGPRPAPRELGLSQFFMKFRGPQAHCNRRQKPIVCPTLDAGLSQQYWG